MQMREGWCYIGTFKKNQWIEVKLSIQDDLPQAGRSYPAAASILLKPSAPNPPLYAPPPDNIGVIPTGASVEVISVKPGIAGSQVWVKVRAPVQ
jgi:hypothetical protein